MSPMKLPDNLLLTLRARDYFFYALTKLYNAQFLWIVQVVGLLLLVMSSLVHSNKEYIPLLRSYKSFLMAPPTNKKV